MNTETHHGLFLETFSVSGCHLHLIRSYLHANYEDEERIIHYFFTTHDDSVILSIVFYLRCSVAQ